MRRLLVAAAICLLSAGSASAASTILTPTPLQHFVDNTGFACYNCQLFTYAAGTDTKLNTFTDSTGNTPNTDPIILNARGEASVWLAAGVFYKFVLAPNGSSDPPTNPFWTVDNISALGGSGLFPSFFEAPAGPTYDLSGTDNGAVIVSSGASAGLALVLPSTTTISSGWTIAIDPSTGHPVSLTVNGSSGGNIITDTGASVTALNNLGNQRIQIQFDGTNFQFATNRKTVIDPRDFGCALDGVTDDTVCFQATINYAEALVPYNVVLRNGTPVIDCGGREVFISATELIVNATGLSIQHCGFVLNPSSNWEAGFPNTSGAIYIDPTNRNVDLSYNSCNGNNVGDCFNINGHALGDTMNSNYGVHFVTYFMYVNGVFGRNNHAQQWAATDANYCNRSTYTASGIWSDGGGDGQYTNNTMNNMLYPIQLGDSSGGTATEDTFIGNHPFNGAGAASPACTNTATGTLNSTSTVTFASSVLAFGWSPGDSISGANIPTNTTISSIAGGGLSLTMSAAATGSGSETVTDAPNNPVDVMINAGSGGHLFSSMILDHGQVVMNYTVENKFFGLRLTEGSDIVLTSWFVANAQVSGDTFQAEIIPPLEKTSGAGTGIPLITMAAAGGNSWSAAPILTAGGVLTSMDSFLAYGGFNFISSKSSASIVSHFFSNNAMGCIGINGNFGGQLESDICQNQNNNMQFEVAANATAMAVTKEGNVGFGAASASPTCSSAGCGSGFPIAGSGSNVTGHVTLGTGPSSPLVITFAVQGGYGNAWSSVPNCNVSDQSNIPAVTSVTPTVNQISIAGSGFSAGNVIRWHCFQEGL